MSAESAMAETASAATDTDTDLSAQIALLVRDAAGEDGGWPGPIGPETRLDGDLFLDSADLAALDAALRGRYGEGVDLAGHIAGLGLEEIIGLTVADVAAYVAQRSGAR